MNLQTYVEENRKIIDLVNDRVGGKEDVDRYYVTLDYATARFNTILLKISQDKLLADEHKGEVSDCFNAIQDFYNNVQRYRFWPRITRPFIKLNLHGIGTRRIPKIKNLLELINSNDKD